MRTLKGLVASIAIGSLTLISYPGVSFGLDCSYGGVFDPPLDEVDNSCNATGSPKARGGLVVNAPNPMFVRVGVKLTVNTEEQGSIPTPIPGSLIISSGGGIGTVEPIEEPIRLIAAGQINNFGGGLNLIGPFDPALLKAGKGINLLGSQAVIDPSSLIVADTIRLATDRGNITLNNNTVLISTGDNAVVDLVAPRGNITLTNTTIAVLKNGVEIGTCNFQVKKKGGTVTFGLNTNLLCIPKIKK